MKNWLVKFDDEVLRWEDQVANAHEMKVEELDKWKELLRQSTMEAQHAEVTLKVQECKHEQVILRMLMLL